MTAGAGTHSPLAPSFAPVWMHCAGAVAAAARNPEQGERTEAREGQATHELGGHMIRGEHLPMADSTGWLINDEMRDAARVWADSVNEIRLGKYGKPEFWPPIIERAMPIGRVHAQCYGTPDLWVLVQPPGGKRLLIIDDFKYGHRAVDVFENWQLLLYAEGIIDNYRLDDLNLDVLFRVVQPRNYQAEGPVQEWRFTAHERRAQINQAASQASLALRPGAPTVAGTHCRDCRGRWDCATLQRAAWSAMAEAGGSMPLDLPPLAVAVECAQLEIAAKLIKYRIEGLQEQIKHWLDTGTEVPGYAFKETFGREKWKDEAAAISLANLFGVDITKGAPMVITPKQAIDKGVPADAARSLSYTPRGEGRLSVVDHSLARRVFGIRGS